MSEPDKKADKRAMEALFLAAEVDLSPLDDALLSSIRSSYENAYQEKYGKATGSGLYTERDWRRIAWAIRQIPNDTRTILDVGAGPGALINYLTLSERFDQATAIDIREYSKFVRMSDNVDLRIMDAADMSFEDSSFDCVICMEVIEHVPDEKMRSVIRELRRVARKRLIMSVPFEEPEPLPSYHLQRFDKKRIIETFPRAEYQIVGTKGRGVPWLFATESFRTLAH